jgi:hypothetical protein
MDFQGKPWGVSHGVAQRQEKKEEGEDTQLFDYAARISICKWIG